METLEIIKIKLLGSVKHPLKRTKRPRTESGGRKSVQTTPLIGICKEPSKCSSSILGKKKIQIHNKQKDRAGISHGEEEITDEFTNLHVKRCEPFPGDANENRSEISSGHICQNAFGKIREQYQTASEVADGQAESLTHASLVVM